MEPTKGNVKIDREYVEKYIAMDGTVHIWRPKQSGPKIKGLKRIKLDNKQTRKLLADLCFIERSD